MTATMLVVRTTVLLEALAPLVRERIGGVDPDVRVMRLSTFSDMLERPLARPRFTALLLTVFGFVALALAPVGLYAVMAAHVRQRDREIAIRLALGATTNGMRRYVLAEAMRLVWFGAFVGLTVSAVASRVLRGVLFEVGPVDPLTLFAAVVLLIIAAAVASLVPVLRATRLDAAAVLRGE